MDCKFCHVGMLMRIWICLFQTGQALYIGKLLVEEKSLQNLKLYSKSRGIHPYAFLAKIRTLSPGIKY